MQHIYSGLWAQLRTLVSFYYHRVVPPAAAAWAPVRGITLLVVVLVSVTGAWAQAPAFTTSRTTGTAYTSINATGTSFTFTTLTGSTVTDDNTSTAVTLPSGFAFSYLGTPVTGFVACTNGWLSLDPTVTANGWENNLGGASSTNTIIPKLLAPMWDDLVCQGDNDTPASLASSMKYQVSGTAPNRVLTVEWIGMEVYQNDGPNLNFQVKLFETTNVIQYQYGIMSGFDGRRNYNYTYSLGLNGSVPTTSYLAQQTTNSNFFAQANATAINSGANGLNIVPASYSQVQFTPSASLVSGTAPNAVVPANDETGGAITLPVGSFSPTSFATTYSSANATASAGITTCSAAAPGTPDDDVWFKFTTTSTQNVTVTLRGSGGYDGVLQVFSNAGTTALGCVNATLAGLTETYNNTNLPAGTYYVRVYEAGTGSGTTGQFAVAVYAQPPAPANNECAAAIALTSAGTCTPVTGTSLGATASGNPATCNGTPDDDVWYSFTTAATARAYTLTLDGGTDFDGVLQVLSGTCSNLTSIGCVNSTLDGGIETISMNSLAVNTTYYVRVYHAAAGYGSGEFTLCLTDNFPRITSFTPTSGPVGTSVTLTGTGLSGATSVSFNSTTQTTITANTADNLTVAVPTGATTGTLTVTTPIGTSAASAQAFTVIPPPTLTTVAPTPGGLGQSITLTGTNLASPTALTINGANALAGILSNSGTSLVVRVPTTATATGTVVVTTAAGTASLAFTVMTPPGNALAIDGGANYVEAPAQPGFSDLRATGYTLEAWVYLNAVGGVQSVIRKDGDYNFYITNGLPRTQIWSTPTTLRETTGTTALTAGRWHHVTGTWDGTNLRVYLNGVDVTGATNSVNFTGYTLPLRLGRSAIFNEPLNGRLDEVRIYNTPLTLPQIQADMTSPAASVPASLKFHLNFDQGTPAGNNAGLTTLYDLVSAQPATLTNFNLTSGNTTSNYVESYAMVVPTATAATARTATGFTANWTAPAVGTVNNGYRLDVSTVATFATVITGSPFTVSSGTSQVVTGLASNTTYYYRVRADKTSVTGQGATSNVITVCPLPVATAQNLTLALNASGSATLTATALNNGSTANCGPAAANTLTVQKVTTGVAFGEVAEGGTLTLTAPTGGKFVSVEFASYGTPTGTNGTYATSGCHAGTSLAVVRTALLGNNSGSIGANNNVFGDPCNGTVKKLAVRATYTVPVTGTTPAPQLTYSCADFGPNYVELTVTDAGNNTSTALATVTVTAPVTPTTTWNGNASTDWSDCANWSYGKVPDAATNAIIPTGLVRYPVLNTGTVAMKDLTINNNFTLGSTATLQVNGNFTFNGTATLGGTVALVGTATQQLGGTSTASTFPNLTVTKTAGTVELQRDLPLEGTLTFTAGITNVGVLNTNAYRINLAPSATLTETETSYVVGKVAASRTLAAGTAQSFSGIGLTLTPAAGSSAPGLTPVVRTTGTALTGVGTSVSVLRNFDIQPANRTGLNVSMVFSYFEHELNSIPENNLVLFKSETGASNTWGSQRPATLDATANTMTKTGITSFSIWTLGDAARPLPVELTAFTAAAEGPQAVRLHWATASEKNSAYFVIERSLDGASFREVGTLPAAGTSNSARTYQLLDARLPAGVTLLYYRLQQVDIDGTVAYSPVQFVKLTPSAKPVLTLAPNPTHGRATLEGAVAGAPIYVYDAVGRLVCTTTADATGTAQLMLPVGQPTGVYLVRTSQEVLRLILE